LDDRDSIPGSGSDGIFFSSPPRLDRLWDGPAPYPVGTGSDADQSLPSSAEIKNAEKYTEYI